MQCPSCNTSLKEASKFCEHCGAALPRIRSGLAIIDRISKPQSNLPLTFQARIGIASGVVVVGDLVREGVTQENAAIGETTNLADPPAVTRRTRQRFSAMASVSTRWGGFGMRLLIGLCLLFVSQELFAAEVEMKIGKNAFAFDFNFGGDMIKVREAPEGEPDHDLVESIAHDWFAI